VTTGDPEKEDSFQVGGWQFWLEMGGVLLIAVVQPFLLATEPRTPFGPAAGLAQIAKSTGLAVFVWLLLARERKTPVLASRQSSWVAVVAGGLGVAAMIWLAEDVSWFLFRALGVPDGDSGVDASYRMSMMSPWVRLMYPIQLLTGAIYEELVFRAFLLRRLAKVIGGRMWPVLISSSLFAVKHGYPLRSTLVVFVGGLVYACVYERYGTIDRTVIGHWIHNLILMRNYV